RVASEWGWFAGRDVDLAALVKKPNRHDARRPVGAHGGDASEMLALVEKRIDLLRGSLGHEPLLRVMALRARRRAPPSGDLAERALGECLRAYPPPHPGGYVDF